MAPKSTKIHPTKGGAAGKKVAAGSKGKLKIASDTKGKWMASTTIAAHLQHLSKLGYLPPPGVADCRLPVMKAEDGEEIAEVIPQPREDERACFIPFLLRGLGFLVHPFFLGLIHFYGLQLHHLTPNGILHIACFVALCECFLAIELHFVSGGSTSK